MTVIKRAFQEAAGVGLRLPGLRQAVRAAGRSGMLPRSLWRRIPVTGRFPILVEGAGELVYCSALMDHLGRILFFDEAGGWEPEVARVIPILAEQAAGVLDIGAHTGLFTMLTLAANPAALSVAVEPVLGNALRLQLNLQQNGLSDRCVLAVVAVSDRPGTVPFDVGPVEIPMTSAIREIVEPGQARVPAVSVDSIAGWLPSVDLVKIDVEGFEHLVFAGAQATLTTFRPSIMVECLPNSRIERFAGLLNGLGYRRFHLLPDSVVPIETIVPRDESPTYNYLLAARTDVLARISS